MFGEQKKTKRSLLSQPPAILTNVYQFLLIFQFFNFSIFQFFLIKFNYRRASSQGYGAELKHEIIKNFNFSLLNFRV